jgi:hypothetical protein
LTFFPEFDLRREWLHQLYNEYETITWGYRIQISTPIIEITDAGSYWGTWDSDNRTIRISSHLIKEHSWDTVTNILKHEIAHQMVSTYYQQEDGHGPLFKHCCKVIGTPDEFCKAGGDLPEEFDNPEKHLMDSSQRDILIKIEKLLALAQSNNENEAFLAMEKANQLIEKYNFERINLTRSSEYTYKIITHKKKRVENYQRRICSILQNHYYVDIIYCRQYDALANETYKTIELFGTIENVTIAEYVYFFLLNSLEPLWKTHQLNNKTTGSKKRSYWLGLLDGFRDKLDKSITARHQSKAISKIKPSHALVLVEDSKLDDFLRKRHPKIRSTSHKGGKIDPGNYNAGFSDGKNIIINKGINKNDGNRGGLLT